MGISKRGRQKWYLEDVRPKKNYVWSNKKMLKVYTLRKDLPACDVARKLKITITQVYNATRLIKKSLHNECFICGNPLTKDEKNKYKGKLIKACNMCREKSRAYKKGRRRIALKFRICIYCQKNKVRPEYVSCTKCISATHRRRYKKNLCGQCGKYPINYPEESICRICAKKNRERATEYRLQKKGQI